MFPSPSSVRAVIFDWGGVFCTPAEPFALEALQKKVGMNVDEIADAVRELYDDYYKGKYTKATFWPLILKKLDVMPDNEINPETLHAAYIESFTDFPEMFELVKELKGKGYHVSLLSNLTPDMRDHIREKYHISDLFTPDIYSCDPDVQVIKPDPMVYKITLEKVDVPSSECLFIDDSAKNVAAAKSSGIDGFLFENPAQCRVELLERL